MLVERSDMLSFRGEPLRAVEQIGLAKRLNPSYPNWYDWSLGFAYFQARRDNDAIAALEAIKDPPNEAYLLLAICRAEIGDPIPPEQILARLRTKDPEWTPKHLERMPFVKDEDRQHWLEGLRKAGILS
jgi:adenylate cyclase